MWFKNKISNTRFSGENVLDLEENNPASAVVLQLCGNRCLKSNIISMCVSS